MGQYHSIYNVTKKESFCFGGAKLWEKTSSTTAAAFLLLLSNSNGRGGGDFCTYPKDYNKLTAQEQADKNFLESVSGRWAGDVIVVQGDYADAKDPGFIPDEELEKYNSITGLVCSALLIADNGDNSDVALRIESELKSGFAGFEIMVKKGKGKDRNGGAVEPYQFPIPKPPKVARPKPKAKRHRR